MYLQINTVKYDTDREITKIYKNLRIVWSQFCTDRLLFFYIRSTSNIYGFIGIQIRCQLILMNSYSVTFGYSQYLVQHSMNDTEGNKNNYSPLEKNFNRLCPSSTTEEYSTHIPKVEGLNPATGTGWEKMTKRENLSWKCQN